jgi:16S rRNA (cytosine1402-N4)-methyltransferase
MGIAHIPVLLEEVANNLVRDSDNLFVDATINGGGHSSCVLERHRDLNLVGLDVDTGALERAAERLKEYSERITLIRGNFRDLQKLLQDGGVASFDCILFDLGLSTYQITGQRGFSFHDDTFLDMRMDDREPLSAYDVVNKYNYEALRRVMIEYGEEYKAARIARTIVEERRKKPIETAKELSEVIEKAKRRTGKVHPATKTFQAIRIEVNHELDNLRAGLSQAIDLVKQGGRIGVISFHSLEDRIVKEKFRESPEVKPITKKPIRPERTEILSNPSSRSAKLRIAERV